MESNIVLGHADLLRDLHNLDLDINLDQLLAERIDLDKSRINSAIETSELGNESNVALIHWLIGIWTNDTAWNGSHATNAATERVD